MWDLLFEAGEGQQAASNAASRGAQFETANGRAVGASLRQPSGLLHVGLW